MTVEVTAALDDSNGELGEALESFSFAVAREDLERDIAGGADPRDALGRCAARLPELVETSILRHHRRLRELEMLQRKKVANVWRTIALEVITGAEDDGGSLATFGGHADFIGVLRQALAEAPSLTEFFDRLEAERRRWRLSLFGRKKIEIIGNLKERISSETRRLAERAAAEVQRTFVDRVEEAQRGHDLELESIALWYRHLLRDALRRLGPAGMDARWAMVAAWEDDYLRRLAARRQSPSFCLELGRMWARLDEQVAASLDGHLAQLRLDAGGGAAALLPVGDALAAEIQRLGSHRDELEKLRLGWEALTPELRDTLNRVVGGINEISATQQKQFATLLRHHRVATLSDFLDAVRSANHLATELRKRVFDAVAALEPFRGLRARIRRLDTLSAERLKEYERLFA